MSGKLAAELKQGKPFASLEHEALLNLAKTASVLGQAEAAMLKPFDLSPAQYNVLRILKGAGEGGRNCQEIGERLVAKDPDITRLIDRLMDRGLVTRSRSEEDRRVVVTRITRDGAALLAKIAPHEEALPRELLGRLGRRKLETLIELLEEAREKS